jgi:putative endonuclease
LSKHQLTGKKGEALAIAYIKNKGFTLLHQNWRYSRYEVDIIASKENVLHFIEVKTRSSLQFGTPEESVSDKKIENLMNASEEFQYRHPEWKRVQYDVLSILLHANGNIEYFYIEDVYL